MSESDYNASPVWVSQGVKAHSSERFILAREEKVSFEGAGEIVCPSLSTVMLRCGATLFLACHGDIASMALIKLVYRWSRLPESIIEEGKIVCLDIQSKGGPYGGDTIKALCDALEIERRVVKAPALESENWESRMMKLVDQAMRRYRRERSAHNWSILARPETMVSAQLCYITAPMLLYGERDPANIIGRTDCELVATWRPLKDWGIGQALAVGGSSLGDLETRQRLYEIGGEREALADWPFHPFYVTQGQAPFNRKRRRL